jgi:threonine aldolase
VITDPWRGFASDNYAGIHPEVLAAIAAANVDHQSAYGDDALTAQLQAVIAEHFGPSAQVFPVFNGTGANVVALQAMTERWEAVVCAQSAHVHADEGGAPEKMAGLKLWTVPGVQGKLTPDFIDTQVFDIGFVHRAQPTVVSITQSTEMGTAYSVAELRALVDHAHARGLMVHMDGARIANAAARLGVPLRAITTDIGIDVLSLGGTKNGAMLSEAVVTFSDELAAKVPFIRKTSMQLSCKMRFISAQLLALLTDDLWRRNADHANAMADRLAAGAATIPGVQLTSTVQANAVFAILPADVTRRLQERFHFYVWNHMTGEVRWMCSWDTSEEDVDSFVVAITQEMSAAGA